tara:strand:+ start:370 stop:639 length:270 start_codon:yes stop_codon:yes gene_type:complete
MSTTRTFETNITVTRDDNGDFISATFFSGEADQCGYRAGVIVERHNDIDFQIQTTFSDFNESRGSFDQAYGVAMVLFMAQLQVQGSIFA